MAEMWVLDPVDWDELQDIVAATGATLITRPPAGTGDRLGDFADAIGDHSVDEAPIWTSAHRTAAGWVWGDGTAIDPSYWRDGDVNGDNDPSNDSVYASLVGDKLVAGPGYTAILYSSLGTQYRDHMLGGLDNVTLKLFGGDDYYNGTANGGVLDAGAGNDQIVLDDFGAPQASIVIDGDGQDDIDASQAIIKASRDGDADHFATGGRVTYSAGLAGVQILLDAFGEVVVTSAEFGADRLEVAHVVGTNFNDTIEGVDRISGGRGNDVLTPLSFAEGGDGDDYLVASSNHRVELRGENGNDTIVIFSEAKVGGGAGVDSFVFGQMAHATITDYADGETIDISNLLTVDRETAYADGYLKQTVSGGYTHLWIDANGGGDAWTELATIKGSHDLSGSLIFF